MNHVGFTVDDLIVAIALYEKLGFKLSLRFEKPEPKAHVAILKDANGGGLELWQFEDNHPSRQYIGQHTAFMCDDVLEDAYILKQAGYEEIIPFTEGVILDYIFMKDPNGAVYELAQEKKHD